MAFYDKFPYTNFQELNLDWLTQEVSKVRDNRDASDASAAAALASEQAAAASAQASAESAAASAESATEAAGSASAAAASKDASAEYLEQIGTHTAGAVADWLKENLTPTTPPIDATLTVSGAAADAKKTGDAVNDLKRTLDYVSSETRNIADIKKQLKIGYAWNGFKNADRATCVIPIRPNAQYALSVSGGSFDDIFVAEKVSWEETTNVYNTSVINRLIRTSDASANVLAVQFSKTGISAADFDNVQLQVEYGGLVSPYIEPISAYDRVVRNEITTYVTPEMYGAWGDGIHDDTLALQAALDSGKNVVANGDYLITDSISFTSTYMYGRRFIFNRIRCNENKIALKINGRNGYVDGIYLESNGPCVSFGDASITYDWFTHFSILKSLGGACVSLGGPQAVSEITITGEQFLYYSSCIYFNLSQYWVGQIVCKDFRAITTNENAGAAFFANGASNPLTGLTCINISLEGAHGGFNFVNSQASHPIETLNCFGLRTGEMSVLHGYPVLRYTGAGVLRGKIILDICDNATAFDVSLANMKQCFTVEGRINDNGKIYGMLVGNGKVMSPVVFPIAS